MYYKRALALLVLGSNLHAMEPEKPRLTEDDKRLLRSRNYNKEQIDRMIREGLNHHDQEFLNYIRPDHQDTVATVNDWGYNLVWNEEAVRFDPSWRPLPRSPEDRRLLHSWGFTDRDVDQLTISDIRNPLNDPRILRAAQESYPGVKRDTFGLYGSQHLWPNQMPSEADLLLTLPILLRLDPEGINMSLRGWTVLGVAAYGNYLRVVRMLLQQRYIDVNKRVSNYSSALEFALEKGHKEMVALLLSHTDTEITPKALQLAQEKPEIKELLSERQKNKELVSEALSTLMQASTTSGGLPVPVFAPRVFDMNKYAQNKLPASPYGVWRNGQLHPHKSNVKKWVVGSTLVGIAATIAYYGKQFFTGSKPVAPHEPKKRIGVRK